MWAWWWWWWCARSLRELQLARHFQELGRTAAHRDARSVSECWAKGVKEQGCAAARPDPVLLNGAEGGDCSTASLFK